MKCLTCGEEMKEMAVRRVDSVFLVEWDWRCEVGHEAIETLDLKTRERVAVDVTKTITNMETSQWERLPEYYRLDLAVSCPKCFKAHPPHTTGYCDRCGGGLG